MESVSPMLQTRVPSQLCPSFLGHSLREQRPASNAATNCPDLCPQLLKPKAPANPPALSSTGDLASAPEGLSREREGLWGRLAGHSDWTLSRRVGRELPRLLVQLRGAWGRRGGGPRFVWEHADSQLQFWCYWTDHAEGRHSAEGWEPRSHVHRLCSPQVDTLESLGQRAPPLTWKKSSKITSP